MPKYQYKAKDMNGRMIEGIFDAPNKDAVSNMIRQKSFYQLEINEIVERKDINEMGFLGKIKVKELSVYCKQFSSILKAGVPLIQCLGMLGDQTENKILKSITKNIKDEVQKGSSLSQAMSLHTKKLPPMLINMVAAGEASGTLDNSFAVMAVHFEKEHKLKSKVQAALRYPIIVACVAVIVVIVMLTFVIPIFADMFSSSGSELPMPTKVLIAISDFLRNNFIVFAMSVVIIIVFIKLYISSVNGRIALDKIKLRMPVFGSFTTKSIAASFARTMSSLMSTGVSITEALEITGKVFGNVIAKNTIDEVIRQVKEGKGLYEPMIASKIFPPMLTNMIMLGEETGTLDEMLHGTAEFYEEEVERGAATLTAMLEPMTILVLGGIVVFIVMAIALPMFNSYSLVGQA